MEHYRRSRPAPELTNDSTAKIQPRSFGEPLIEHPQQVIPVHDLSQVDLFSHTPQRRPIANPVQAKLMMGQPNDLYEQEADHGAEQVVSMPASTTPGLQPKFGTEKSVDNQPRDLVKHQYREINSAISPQRSTVPLSTPERPIPAWSGSEVRAIQRQLRRLGLYHLGIDGSHGPGTDAALVEAFGDDSWRSLDAATVLTRLTAASPRPGRQGQHDLRYGEMFRDGVLDMTLGVGFDETNAHSQQIIEIRNALVARSFRLDTTAAQRIYRQAGRAIGSSAFGQFYVRENALTYQPPAGNARGIHAVVRLVTSPDGSQGAEAAGAFREGMTQSDVSFYGGHGRYGSGPDFDRNMSFELLDPDGNIEQAVEDYDVLEHLLAREGRPHGRGAWQQFLWRDRHHRINVIGANAGNVFLNPQNKHQEEFGSKLMYWNLRRQGGTGATPITGRGGELDQAIQSDPNRRYRLWVFDGCRTQDYVTSIRSTPALDTRSTDVIATQRSVYWQHIANTLAAFLDSVLGQQSAEQVVKGMNTENQEAGKGSAFRTDGTSDNPVFR